MEEFGVKEFIDGKFLQGITRLLDYAVYALESIGDKVKFLEIPMG